MPPGRRVSQFDNIDRDANNCDTPGRGFISRNALNLPINRVITGLMLYGFRPGKM